jgi:hypothetical protein
MFLKVGYQYCKKRGVWLVKDRDEKELERLGRLPPETKVGMAIDMTDAMLGVCAEGIKAQFPGISEKKLMEKLRERLDWGKRRQKRRRRV